ncbi:hypothetical protein LguiA_017062 [Lonicera macranthoides]
MLADIFPQKSLRDHHHQDSRIETEPVVRSLICVPHTIFLDCASNENVSLIEDDDVPIPPWTFLIPDQDGDPMTINIPSDVNMNNMQIPEHVRFQEYEGNQNRNGDEEDGLVTSEVVPGAGGGR